MDAPRWKFSVGPYQGWLVGSQSWEVRDKRTGETIGTARNMSDCCRLAERFHEEDLRPDAFSQWADAEMGIDGSYRD